MGIDDFLLSVVASLIATSISTPIDNGVIGLLERRRIQRRMDAAIDELIQPITHFLTQEKITEDQQRLLIEACQNELKPIVENPENF